ncbi:DUF2231 domain-containing protein [Streptomyces sp. NPDC057428]|uniref:DUF2231 domain-containing protein n=1 Tax=Streptomyces sp. NPDC057428 TaxID=3346129 RepID=UPI003678D025
MGPTEINGIPAHPLLVHFVVVLVSLTALVLPACALWPSVMRRFGLAPPVLALVTLAAVPLTTHAGEWLAERVNENALLERHTEMGNGLLPWAVGLFVMATALWWTYRHVGTSPTPDANRSAGTSGMRATPLRIAAVLLSLVVAVGAIVQVYRIGDSGAKATWGSGVLTLPVARTST